MKAETRFIRGGSKLDRNNACDAIAYFTFCQFYFSDVTDECNAVYKIKYRKTIHGQIIGHDF